MTLVIRRRDRLLRSGSRIRDLLGYRMFLWREGRSSCRASADEDRFNERVIGYPSNHRYSIRGGRLVPGLQLYERWRRVEAALPERLDSLLDIGCCRGFYVLQAAHWPGCRLAAGIDVHEPFVSLSEEAARLLRMHNTAFHLATIDQIQEGLPDAARPFQVVLLLGTYHYIFWGSRLCDHALRSHERILACLANLTTDRVIFSGRLELDRLPSALKARARCSPEATVYNTDSFLRAAETFFDIHQAGFLGSYPLLVMQKKPGTSQSRHDTRCPALICEFPSVISPWIF
jgi:hypothetical protein